MIYDIHFRLIVKYMLDAVDSAFIRYLVKHKKNRMKKKNNTNFLFKCVHTRICV